MAPRGPPARGRRLSRDRTAVMDLTARVAVDGPVDVAAAAAILLADGVFLQRPELDPLWDLRIWVQLASAPVRP